MLYILYKVYIMCTLYTVLYIYNTTTYIKNQTTNGCFFGNCHFFCTRSFYFLLLLLLLLPKNKNGFSAFRLYGFSDGGINK